MKKLLYISPQFPPGNAVGARRALNIVRHLDRDAWQTIVLTSPVPAARLDPLLLPLVPEDLVLYAEFGHGQPEKTAKEAGKSTTSSAFTRLLDQRGPYYIPFDEHMWHLPRIFRFSRQLIRRHRPDLILVNADPWSGLWLGHKLSAWSGIPWIADLRDPWSLHDYKMRLRPAIIRSVIRYYEKVFLQSASRVVLNTQQCCEAYREHYKAVIETRRFTWIRNAFDREIYDKAPPVTSKERIFSLHYFGSFRVYVDPDPLFQLLTTFIRKRGLTPDDIELVLYGSQRPRDMELAEKTGLQDFIRLQPAISARNALVNLSTASVLVLVEGPNRKLQLPAKLYDYLASGKPVLALSDNPELEQILTTTATGLVADYHNEQEGLEMLDDLYTGKAGTRLLFDSGEIEKYAVREQIRAFSDLFDEVLEEVS